MEYGEKRSPVTYWTDHKMKKSEKKRPTNQQQQQQQQQQQHIMGANHH